MANSRFWEALQQLVNSGDIVIDRPAHSYHPHYLETAYPWDYGYITDTNSSDGEELDVWCCDGDSRRITAMVTTVDLYKHDAEIKVLLGCTAEQAQVIHAFYEGSNQYPLLMMRASTDTEES